MPAKPRSKVPKAVEKRAFQEALSHCPFCPESDVASLQVHHIDGDPANNLLENLLCVCANCHTKITGGVLSEADVRTKKREIAWTASILQAKTAVVSVANSTVHGDIAHTIEKSYTKITTPTPPPISHPPGSIGADLKKKAYISYLVTRYFKYRSADHSYGRKGRFSHSVIHQNIEREFGYQTYFNPIENYDGIVDHLRKLIDGTIQGKRNAANNVRNYHSFEEHFQRPKERRATGKRRAKTPGAVP